MRGSSEDCSPKARTEANRALSTGSRLAFCLRKPPVLISEHPSLFLDVRNGPD